MWRSLRTASGVVVALLLLPVAAHAQASITGVARDTSGAVLPGVTVEASSPALIEKVRSVVTDGTGQYRIESLRPGTYSVTFTLPGFATVRRDGIELTGTFTASVNAEMRVGAVEETVTVSGETPVVDVQSTTRQRVIDREVIDTLPTARTDRALAALIPSVVYSAHDVGGVEDTQNVGGLSVHGLGDTRILMNNLSVSISVSTGGAHAAVPNMAGMEELAVDTSGVDAEQATGGARLSYIMKDGGNTFSGTVFANLATEAMQGDNITPALRQLGVRHPTALKMLYDINPGFGGPLKRDRLWFYAAGRRTGRQNYPAGIHANRNANRPDVWEYAPDPSSRPYNDKPRSNGQIRLTWQATPTHKVGASAIWDDVCYCPETISATEAPEAALFRPIRPQRNVSVDWTAPVTNRLLLEASMFTRREDVIRKAPPGTNRSMVSVSDQGLGNLIYRAPSAGRDGGNLRDTWYKTFRYRAAASYITGAHAFKAGFTGGWASETTDRTIQTLPYEYRFNNGVPNQITLYAHPLQIGFRNAEGGAYVQDKWTIGRLTINYGVRYDFYMTSFPEQRLGPAPLVPTRDIVLAPSDGLSWHDVTPKSGAAYDLFGNGKTAVKVTLNKYLEGLGSAGIFGNALNPVGRLVNTTTRSWNDANRNFVPDCNLLLPQANGECGALANANFGRPVPGASYDPDILNGWGLRGYNWEFSAGVQQEILPRVSIDVGYFRRWFGNFYATDNLTLAAADFDSFNLTAPSDPRLPGGGGYVVSGLSNLKPEKFGLRSNDFVTRASNYGKQIQHWNGVDVTLNARPRSLLLQGGLSTGRTSTDNCAVLAQLPEVNPVGLPYCHVGTAFRTQLKFVAAYTIPRVDVQVSSTWQNLAGPEILANYAAPNAEVAPSLGRNLAGGERNVTVNLVAPGTLYGERLNQVDVRVAKILRYGRTRTSVMLDLFNALNASTVLQQNNTYGGRTPWRVPQAILNPRFVKIGAQIDF